MSVNEPKCAQRSPNKHKGVRMSLNNPKWGYISLNEP